MTSETSAFGPTGRVTTRRRLKRLRSGHQWVFSNEIEKVDGGPEAGSVVEIVCPDGRFEGIGFYHPHSLIAVRVLSHERETIGASFFERRIAQALELRRKLFPGSTAYRLVHAEGDFLPGLTVDRYGEVVVFQSAAAGIDRARDILVDALERLLRPKSIVERSESRLRRLEGLDERSGLIRGVPPGEVEIEEEGIRFVVDPMRGQKTGHFYDQRANRCAAGAIAPGARVLDLYCYSGGFGLQAARAGAEAVVAVDQSPEAVGWARENAARNGFAERFTFFEENVFEVLPRLATEREKFDLVILDPPSFTRTKKQVPAAKRGYLRLHGLVLPLLRRGGFLATSCCSYHIYENTFREVVLRAATERGRRLREIVWSGQAPDHPVLPAMPETRYLSFGLLQAL